MRYSLRSSYDSLCDVIVANHSIKKLTLILHWQDDDEENGSSDFSIERLLSNTQTLEEFHYYCTSSPFKSNFDAFAKGLTVNKSLKNVKIMVDLNEMQFANQYKQIEQLFVALERNQTLQSFSFHDITGFVPDDPDPLERTKFAHFPQAFEKINVKSLTLQVRSLLFGIEMNRKVTMVTGSSKSARMRIKRINTQQERR